jgi:N-acetylmuramic acid 6-phosphate (MurNAc-6-P) etherase
MSLRWLPIALGLTALGRRQVAIVALLAGVSADEARLRLKVAGGNVRRRLEAR